MPDAELTRMRTDYAGAGFDRPDLAPTWHEQLARWLADAHAAGVIEPNAMVLATADRGGRPSSRTVLCKSFDAHGVVFYTSYTSAKSHDLRRGATAASVTFPWYPVRRQVHLRGTVQRTPDEEADAYWVTRPRGAQLGAWASTQSAVVADRAVLDDALAEMAGRFADVEQVPRPAHWGGWRIVPEDVEFWQGRADRMHDRLRYEVDRRDHTGERRWQVCRLAP